MKLHIDHAPFLMALSHVQGIAERKAINPVLANVLLEAKGNTLVLTTTNLDITVQETIPAKLDGEGGSTTVNASMLYEIVKKLDSGSEIKLQSNDLNHQLTVKSGKARFQLPTLPAKNFSATIGTSLPHIFALSAEELRFLLSQPRLFVSQEEARYALMGIYLHTHQREDHKVLRTVATDGQRLAFADVPLPDGADGMPGVILPKKTGSEILRLLESRTEEVSLSLSLTQILVSVGNIRFQSRLIDALFPQYEEAIPKELLDPITISRLLLKDAIERVFLFSQEKTRCIQFVMETNQITLSAHNVESGSGTEELEIVYHGPRIEMLLNGRYCLDVLNQIDCPNLLWRQERSANRVVIQGEDETDATFILMSMGDD